MGSRKCGAFLSSWDRDPHPTCTRCRGRVCTRDMTCDFCVGWLPSQWEAFAKKRAYKDRFPLRRRLLLVRGLLWKSCALRPLPLLLPSLQEVRLRGRGLGMHLVLRPMRLPLLPLDLGPARGVEVSLVARPVRASVLLPPRLLRELGRGKLLVRNGLPLPAPLPRLPLPAHHSTLCDMVSQESLRWSAPVLDPPVFPDLQIEEQGRIAKPALGRPALVTGPVVLALLTARGREFRRRASSQSLSSRERSRRERSRSSDRFRSRRVRSCSRGDRSQSSDRYRSRRQRSRSPARLGGRCDRSRPRDPPRGLPPPLTARDQRREDDAPDVSNRSVWRLLLSPRLLLSLECLLQ